ncbi:GNAT family N-acetyltransferase [Undibacterium sp.]|uniref:GNAT family N-acetyltransferase n=1 Tax=Undibacterium sp. TaxID=1914977 RepID=UPI00374D3705
MKKEEEIAGTVASADSALRDAESETELRACYAVMKELRPHLENEADFLQRVARMRTQNYRILAAWEGEQVVALAGYRLQENLVYGKFLYVDDLVTAENARGQRWGAQLLDALNTMAEQTGCKRLALDTAVSNALAQRFYFRQGLLFGAMRFHKLLAQ